MNEVSQGAKEVGVLLDMDTTKEVPQ